MGLIVTWGVLRLYFSKLYPLLMAKYRHARDPKGRFWVMSRDWPRSDDAFDPDWSAYQSSLIIGYFVRLLVCWANIGPCGIGPASCCAFR